MTQQHRTLTPHGIAGILARGIRANFAPEHWMAETDRLVDFLLDLAMARDTEGLTGSTPVPSRCDRERAKRDAIWLDAVAGDLASANIPQKPGR
jgi:hypothetical protein